MDTISLNEEQQKAATHVDGPMLVLAGAGSGKTRVVGARIAHLLGLGVLPSDILALTFTNKAANEMHSRIKLTTHASILSSTFHSLGARILRESITELGYSRDFTIYDSEDSLKLIKSCLESMQIKDEKGLSKKIQALISSSKNDLIGPNEIASSFSSEEEEIFADVFPFYQKRLKEYNCVDFDDLLFLTVKLLKDKTEVREEYQNRWLFILVDEYQDTNFAQYSLIKLLVAKHQNLFVVGDPDQSIYGWRGAQYQNILNFDKDFPQSKIIYLEHNYRSTNTILQASNGLINHNTSRYDKKLWSQLGEGEKIGFYLADNDKQEVRFIVDTLVDYHINKHIPFQEMVIFYRTNSQSRNFEDYLIAKQTPYVIYGGLSFYQRKEIKDILAFLRMLLTNSDYISFARTLNIPKRGIGSTTLKKITHLSDQRIQPILDLCQQLCNQSVAEIKLSAKQSEGLKDYLSIIAQLRELAHSHPSLDYLIQETMRLTRYFDHLKEDPDSFDDRKDNLEELIIKAAEWQETNEKGTLSQFLEELTLLSHMDEKDKIHSLKLMTLHNGKGLEFTVVFIAGMEEDLLPHINSKDSLEQLEEERRLCYVGMTRAKRYLYLTACRFRHLWGNLKMMKPSRFLDEIPKKFLQSFSNEPSYDNEIYIEQEDHLPTGCVVMHKTFGKGIVTKAYDSSLGLTYDVNFVEDNMTRSLVAKYAKLTRCF